MFSFSGNGDSPPLSMMKGSVGYSSLLDWLALASFSRPLLYRSSAPVIVCWRVLYKVLMLGSIEVFSKQFTW